MESDWAENSFFSYSNKYAQSKKHYITPGATKDSDFGGWVRLPGVFVFLWVGVGLASFTKNLRYLKWRYERTLFTATAIFGGGFFLA